MSIGPLFWKTEQSQYFQEHVGVGQKTDVNVIEHKSSIPSSSNPDQRIIFYQNISTIITTKESSHVESAAENVESDAARDTARDTEHTETELNRIHG